MDCSQCGSAAVYAGRRNKTFCSVLGELTLQRAYYYCSRCQKGFFPRDRRLGLEGSSLTPATIRMVATVAAMVSFVESSQLLKELAGLRVDSKQVERTAETLGQQIAADERSRIQTDVEKPVLATMYVGIDGTGIPMRTEELTGRLGKQPDGSAKSREVKLCAVWTAESVDTEGLPARDPGSISYSAAIETAAMADTSKNLSPFAQRVQREAVRRSVSQASRVVVIGDGAAWIWNIAGELFPKAIQIVDRFHAKQHLAELAKVIWGAESNIGKDWLLERYAELDDGNVEQLIVKLSTHKHYDEVRKGIRYFKQNMHRMRYQFFRKTHICSSSGVVEAGCKVAIGTRLKRSGMHWTLKGSNAIIALRCCILSGRFEDFWENRSFIHEAA